MQTTCAIRTIGRQRSPMNTEAECVFASEAELVRRFCSLLDQGTTAWGRIKFATEFDYRRGRADVIAADVTSSLVLSFEAKLTRWRSALAQAARNRCFAHLSYVVLPRAAWRNASRHAEEFRRRSIGLCTIGPAGIEVHIPACHVSPILPYLALQATNMLQC
jgi:hypothetical protein